MKIYFNRKFILGLFAYIRQSNLSIDRALMDSTDNMLEYYKTKIYPDKLLKYFENKCNDKLFFSKISNSKNIEPIFINNIISLIRKKSFLINKLNKIISILRKKPYLTDNEIKYIYSIIKSFDNIIKYNNITNEELMYLRLNMVYCCDILSLNLSRKEIKTAKKIEHFNQNFNLKCLSINEIAGNMWIEN